MLKTVEGVYKSGKVELAEVPSASDGAKVLVTFLSEPPAPGPPASGKMLTFGMLRREGGRESTLDDFKLAEWHGEPEIWDAD